jgi:RNA polymerase sigma factor (TIGR02999 family)
VHVPPDISQLIIRWSGGDQAALEEITPLVYEELRRLARSALRRNSRESILQPTALVHEAWIRMAGNQAISIPNRGHFYALAAKVMRGILVDQTRRRQAAKRGGSRIEIPLHDACIPDRRQFADFVIVDEALTRLGTIKPRYAQIIELRCLAGLTIEETAEALAVSHATIEREWMFARTWLDRELRPPRHQDGHVV